MAGLVVPEWIDGFHGSVPFRYPVNGEQVNAINAMLHFVQWEVVGSTAEYAWRLCRIF
jgi:hypothetical protein